MFYSSNVSQGIPPVFNHYLETIPAVHSVVVMVSIKSLPISQVPVKECFLFRRVEPRNFNMFLCVARYRYMDLKESEPFEEMLVEQLKDFIREEICFMREEFLIINDFVISHNLVDDEEESDQIGDAAQEALEREMQEALEREIQMLDWASQAGISHLISENSVVSCKGSNLGKRIFIDHVYNFLEKNSRKAQNVYNIPRRRCLKVGMTYEI